MSSSNYTVCVCVSVPCETVKRSDTAKPMDQKPCTNRTALDIWYAFDPKRPAPTRLGEVSRFGSNQLAPTRLGEASILDGERKARAQSRPSKSPPAAEKQCPQFYWPKGTVLTQLHRSFGMPFNCVCVCASVCQPVSPVSLVQSGGGTKPLHW